MTKKCICQICTCGRHTCPHQQNTVINKANGPCTITEYAQKYKPHELEARDSFKPAYQPFQGGEFHGHTTMRDDYDVKHGERPYKHPAEVYRKPEGDVSKVTSYNQDYTEKQAPKTKAIRNEGQRMVPARFEGEPTYRADYIQWATGRQPSYGMQNQWKPPTDRFEGYTTNQSDFKGHDPVPRQSFKPMEAAKQSDTPFDNHTGYRDDYVQHPLQPRFARERETYKPSGAPMDGQTTFANSYKGIPGSRMQSFKPDNKAFNSMAPFEGNTTQRADYIPREVQKPYVHPAEQWVKPDGVMEKETTYNAVHREMPFVKAQAQRPVSANRSKNAPFEGQSTYGTEFRKWEAERVMMPKREGYVPNQAPFEGTSSYKGQFVAHNAPPARSLRPDHQAFQSDAKLDGTTNYRLDYTPKEIKICEAAVIDQGRSRYKFLGLDHGHRFYAPVSETVTPIGTRVPSQSQQRLAMSVA